jgi:ketosteroid isomerase-like protein
MHPHAELIRSFYVAFQRRDHRAMAACYTPDVEFHDPVFTNLSGGQVAAMWRMLCERATDLRIEVGDVRASAEGGSAQWEAWYTFSQTGRRVHNRIEAAFLFQDGKIHRHTDVFDFHAWARQALGLQGLLLGWAAPFQRVVRARAATALERFIRTSGIVPAGPT